MNGQLDKLKRMAKVEVVYVGKVFTVAKATLSGFNLPIPQQTCICAEGIARRSAVDAPDDALGTDIACGRALRALHHKLTQKNGKRIHHHYMG